MFMSLNFHFHRKINYILILLFFAFSFYAHATTSLTPEETAWLKDHKSELVVATETNYPPLSFMESGQWHGISADMIHLIEKNLGVTFSYLDPQNLDSIFANSKSGKPGIITSVKETAERNQFLSFTPVYITLPTVVIINKNSPLGAWPQAYMGKQVGVSKGYSVQGYLEQHYPNIKLVLATDDLVNLKKLSFGEIDAVVMDTASASYFIEKEKITNLRVSDKFEYAYDLSFAVRKDLPILRDILSKSLSNISENDKKMLFNKWVNVKDEPLTLVWQLYHNYFIASAFLIGILIVLFVFDQRRKKIISDSYLYTRSLIEASLDPLVTIDSEGKITDVNQATIQVTGVSKDKLIGSDFSSYFTDENKAREGYLLVWKNGSVRDYHLAIRHSSGMITDVLYNATLYRSPDGKAQGIFAAARDITKQLRTEAEIKIAQERIEAAASAGLIGVWDWDVPNNILMWDKAMYKLYGLKEGDFGGAYEAWARAIHIEDKEYTEGEIQAALDGKREYCPQFRIIWPDGSTHYIKAISKTFYDEQRKPLRMLGINYDMTEQKQIEKELYQAKIAAEAANMAKSRFLATMSHEIRTPMNGILGMAQLLDLPSITEGERRDFAKVIINSGNTLLTLLNDILDLSKIEAEKVQIEAVVCSPGVIINEIKNLFNEAAVKKNLRIETELTSNMDEYYLTDPTRLRQMLSNLTNNAIKFTLNGSVRITASELERNAQGAILEFAVKDTGVGIPQDKLPLIFQPFSQTDSSNTRKFGGTGLGLSIVRGLARWMGGDVGLESVEGQGSRFWFSVRVGVVSSHQENKSSNMSSGVTVSKVRPLSYRVLVVEDDPVNRKVVTAILNKLGGNVDIAENGQQALDLVVNGGSFDLILMDVQMPVMDGNTATKKIRNWEKINNQKRIPIIALTADAFLEDSQRCLDSGMDNVLVKPISIEKLHGAIASHLKSE